MLVVPPAAFRVVSFSRKVVVLKPTANGRNGGLGWPETVRVAVLKVQAPVPLSATLSALAEPVRKPPVLLKKICSVLFGGPDGDQLPAVPRSVLTLPVQVRTDGATWMAQSPVDASWKKKKF